MLSYLSPIYASILALSYIIVILDKERERSTTSKLTLLAYY